MAITNNTASGVNSTPNNSSSTGTTQSARQTSGSTTTAKRRQIPCPFCTGEVGSEQNGRASRSASLFPKFQNICIAITDVFNALTDGTKIISRKDAIGGKCDVCGDKQVIDDPSDNAAAYQAMADYLQQNEQILLENEIKLGNSPGGSRLTRIAGADVLVIGHEINTADSVAIKEGVAGPGGSPTKGKAKDGNGSSSVESGSKEHTHVEQMNVPPNSGGGHYIIQCGNKFNLIVGAQGANIETFGPLVLHGKAGTRVTGAEVTLGSDTGRTAIGGNHIAMEGKHVTIAATGESGCVGIHGSLRASGNVQAGGIACDNLYFSKATCPQKQVSVKGGSPNIAISGPPVWGGPGNKAATKAIVNATKKWTTQTSLDVNMFKAAGPLTIRNVYVNSDLVFGLTYSLLTQEVKQTGVAIVGGVECPVYNYPHFHAIHDGVHTHEVNVPAIDFESHPTAATVNKAANAAGINTPVPAAGSSGENIYTQIWQAISSLLLTLGGKSAAEENHEKMYNG